MRGLHSSWLGKLADRNIALVSPAAVATAHLAGLASKAHLAVSESLAFAASEAGLISDHRLRLQAFSPGARQTRSGRFETAHGSALISPSARLYFDILYASIEMISDAPTPLR